MPSTRRTLSTASKAAAIRLAPPTNTRPASWSEAEPSRADTARAQARSTSGLPEDCVGASRDGLRPTRPRERWAVVASRCSSPMSSGSSRPALATTPLDRTITTRAARPPRPTNCTDRMVASSGGAPTTRAAWSVRPERSLEVSCSISSKAPWALAKKVLTSWRWGALRALGCTRPSTNMRYPLSVGIRPALV